MWVEDLTNEQYALFSTLERTASALSLLGTSFIFLTFLLSEAFQKPINRLIFYASVGNVFSNVATIMARSVVESIHNGNFNGGVCQFQAFLIQMFLPADALWTLVMALNVYLTFYRNFKNDDLRQLEKWYALCCYGIPFIPALVFLFIQNAQQGHMYGNATLWCWVSSDWDIFRVATFYGPVWLVILITLLIYLYAGRDIYQKRQSLREFSNLQLEPTPIPDQTTASGTKAVYVTSQTIVTSANEVDTHQFSSTDRLHIPAATLRNYNVTISALSHPSSPQPQNIDRQSFRASTDGRSSAQAVRPAPIRRNPANEANAALFAYSKVALLFFVAMMITWVPSSANRLYSLTHPRQVNLPLECLAAFVLPLQGFWNAAIYATTSRPACKAVWKQLREGRFGGNYLKTMASAFSGESDDELYPIQARRGSYQERDSIAELKGSRPTTRGERSVGSEDTHRTNGGIYVV